MDMFIHSFISLINGAVIDAVAHRNHGGARQTEAKTSSAHLRIDIIEQAFIDNVQGKYFVIFLENYTEVFPFFAERLSVFHHSFQNCFILDVHDFLMGPKAAESNSRH
jgi:hypothetical protein